jgi:deaminated glutathione amidase
MPMHKLKVAFVQMNSNDDKKANLEQAMAYIREASAGQAQLVILPEYFTYLGPKERYLEMAETIPGPTTNQMSELARELKIGLLCGSMPEVTASRGKIRNTSVFISDTGDLLARYSKIHLFDIDIPGEVSYLESSYIEPGKESTVFSWRDISFGMAICYDLRFPELYRRLMQKGAQVVLVCAAFTRATGKYHWETLLRARAIENQVFLCAANQWGDHPNDVPTYGHSAILDPWGKTLCERKEGNGVGEAEIDLDDLAMIRRQSPILEHIQPWLLREVANPEADRIP